MATIVLGLGNPILGDDAVGCRVAEEISKRIDLSNYPGLEVDQFYRGGIALMERLIGYQRAVIIDSIQDLESPTGTIRRLTLDDLPSQYSDSTHDTSLKQALELGRKIGARLPSEIVIYAISITNQYDFSETLSPQVEASIMPAVQAVLAELE